jgi:hypothetical protein
LLEARILAQRVPERIDPKIAAGYAIGHFANSDCDWADSPRNALASLKRNGLFGFLNKLLEARFAVQRVPKWQ